MIVSHVGKVDNDLRHSNVCLVPLAGWVNELFFLLLEDNSPRPKGESELKSCAKRNFLEILKLR